MSLADRIAAYSRRPTATVRIDGRRYDGWMRLSRDQSYGKGVSGGAVEGRNLPSITPGKTQITWSWGYDGYEVAGFSGLATGVTQNAYPHRSTLNVADHLWLADVQRKDITTTPLNNIAASAAITQILSGAGISRLSIPPLAASGSAWAGDEWVLGTLTPVSFNSTTALQAAQKIAETLGYWLYADASGIVRCALLERKPSDSPFRTLKWGVDFLYAGPPSRSRRADQTKNRVLIRGANTGVQGAQIYDSWQDGAADRLLEVTYDLVEYVNESQAGVASCTGVAKRSISLWSREPDIIEVSRLKADPRLNVGKTIAVDCSLIGASGKPYFIYTLKTALDRVAGDFVQSLSLDGGTGGLGYTTLLPPVASFTWRLVKETLMGVGVVEVFLDGSGSHSLGDGDMVSYTWSTSTPVASGYSSTASGVQAMFVFPVATAAAAISLTVMDTSSKTGTLAQTVTLSGDAVTTVTTRTISVALGSAWAVTPDSGATWRVEPTGDSTLVPEIGGSTLLSTTGTGSSGLRSTADALSTASTALVSLGGTSTALWATEGYPERVWTGVGASLYRSLDGGVTKTLWGTLPYTINGIIEDPAVLNSVLVLAGSNLYHSTLDTPGTAWVVLYAGPAGATARHMVRGRSGATTWICYTGSFIGSALHRVEGPLTVTWPVVSPDVTEVRALALSPDEQSLYAWDAQGRGWRCNGQDGLSVTAMATALSSGYTAQHALHDQDDAIVYLATFGPTAGAVSKYFPLVDQLSPFYVPSAGQQAHRIGVSAATVAKVAELLLPTWGAVGGGVWRFDVTTRTWTLLNSGLPSGWLWQCVAVDPWNTAHWILLGSQFGLYTSVGGHIVGDSYWLPNQYWWDGTTGGTYSAFWETTDAGATWSSLAVSDVAPVTNVVTGYGHVVGSYKGTLSNLTFSTSTPGAWSAVTCESPYADGKRIIRAGAAELISDAGDAPTTPSYGTNGDVVFTTRNFWSTEYLRVAPAAATAITTAPGDGSFYGFSSSIVVYPLSRMALVVSNGSIFGTSDYRFAQPVMRSGGGAWGVLALTDDNRLYATQGYSIYEILDIFGTPTTRTAYTASTAVVDLTAMGQIIAGRLSATTTYVVSTDGGDTWAEIAGPVGADQSNLNTLAIVNSEVTL